MLVAVVLTTQTFGLSPASANPSLHSRTLASGGM